MSVCREESQRKPRTTCRRCCGWSWAPRVLRLTRYTHARTRTHTYTHRWDLGAMGLYTCIPAGDTAPRKCNGPADTTSCPGAGSTPCRENSAKKTLTPFKICYQVRAGLDSCHICT